MATYRMAENLKYSWNATQIMLDSHVPSATLPHASRLTPHASRLTPHASRLTPHASRLTPHASRLTPHASRLTPASTPSLPSTPFDASRLTLRHALSTSHAVAPATSNRSRTEQPIISSVGAHGMRPQFNIAVPLFLTSSLLRRGWVLAIQRRFSGSIPEEWRFYVCGINVQKSSLTPSGFPCLLDERGD